MFVSFGRTINLTDKGTSTQEWEIIRTHSLENDLVGGLMTYLSDSDLMTPEKTLTVYLDTLKTMDVDQMGNYLGLESLLNTSDSAKNSIASALVDQVHKTLDYKITNCDIQSYKATVDTEITTFDSASIISKYQEALDDYLSSADAVIDGSSKRYEHSLELLLNCIENNTDTVTSTVTFHLVNDGASWKLEENSSAIGNAIFGTLSKTPVSDTDEAVTENESDEDLSDSSEYDDAGSDSDSELSDGSEDYSSSEDDYDSDDSFYEE